jgi:hypothetical protein
VIAGVLALSLTACRGSDPSLDARVMQLALVYSVTGPSSAMMSGGSGAASGGAQVECRYADGEQPVIGTATANETGAFEMPLDASVFPAKLPSTAEYAELNEMVECRAGDGGWVSALRQVRLAIG